MNISEALIYFTVPILQFLFVSALFYLLYHSINNLEENVRKYWNKNREKYYKNLAFTGNKDIDREILYHLKPKDIINVTELNKYFFNKVCDQQFFKNYLMRNYPDVIEMFDSEELKNQKEQKELKSQINSWRKVFLDLYHHLEEIEYYGLCEYTRGDYRDLANLSRSYSYIIRDGDVHQALSRALDLGCIDFIEKYGNSTNIKDSAIGKATNIKSLEYLIAKYPNLLTQENIRYCLKWNIQDDTQLQMVKYLFEKNFYGFNVDVHDLLISACANNAPDTLKYILLTHKYALAEEERKGLYYLSLRKENTWIFSVLLETGLIKSEDLTIEQKNNGLIALCKLGDLEGIKKMIEWGADVNYQNGRPLYKLMRYFCKYKILEDRIWKEILEYLLSVGADPRIDDFAAFREVINGSSYMLRDDLCDIFFKYL